MTGHLKAASNSPMTVGGIDAEDERTKRSGKRSIVSLCRPARVRIAWCMVGTAVYQVGLPSSISVKNLSVLKPGVQKTEPPRESGAERPAMSPWIWNKGITLSARSLAESSSVVAMLPAEVQMLAWASGTIFGREGVPDGCRMSA